MLLLKLLGIVCALVVIIYYYKGVNAWIMKPRWCLSKEEYLEFTTLDLKRFGPGLTQEESDKLNHLTAAGYRTWGQQGKGTLIMVFYVIFTLVLVIALAVGTQYLMKYIEQSGVDYQ